MKTKIFQNSSSDNFSGGHNDWTLIQGMKILDLPGRLLITSNTVDLSYRTEVPKCNRLRWVSLLLQSYQQLKRSAIKWQLDDNNNLFIYIYRFLMFSHLSVPKVNYVIFFLHPSLSTHSKSPIPRSLIPVVTSYIQEFQ